MSWKIKAIIALVILAGVFAAGWKLRDYQIKAQKLAAAEETLSDLRQKLVDNDMLGKEEAERADNLESLLSLLREKRVKTNVIREKEYVEKHVYRDCVVPDSGVRMLNDRIRERKSTTDPVEP